MSLTPSGIGVVQVVEERLATALGVRQDASEVAAAIRKYPGEELEQTLVDAKCTVAIARTHDEWAAHPAGRAVAAEPIFDVQAGAAKGSSWKPGPKATSPSFADKLAPARWAFRTGWPEESADALEPTVPPVRSVRGGAVAWGFAVRR